MKEAIQVIVIVECHRKQNYRCSAKQLNVTFNGDKKCCADRIGIEGNGAKHYTETACGTFKPE